MVAAVVVALPDPLVKTARNFVPFWPANTFGTVKVVLVAPATLLNVAPPFVENCHCTVGVGAPLAAAVNTAVPPAFTVTSTGFSVITRFSVITVSTVEPVMLPSFALIVLVPVATPVARPPLVIVATEVVAEAHVT